MNAGQGRASAGRPPGPGGQPKGSAGAVPRRAVQGVEQGHHGPPVGRPSVRTDGPGVRLVDDGVAPGQDRHPVERAPEGGDGLLAGAHRLRRADRHADHPQLLGGRGGPGEGPGRHVGTQVGDVPPPTPDDVGQQGQGQRVVLAGRRAEHDGPPAPAPAVEPGPEATEEAAGDHAGPMLDRDVERALGPPPADGPQRGRHDVQVDLVQLGSGGQRGLDHAPRAPGVTGHQPVLQALGPRRPAAAADRRDRHHRRPVAQLGQRGRGDLPGPRHLARLQQAEADVPVHGHVVHAEQVARPPAA